MLNEMPVLDKGYVALHSCAPNGLALAALQREFFRGALDDKLLSMASIHLQIKCPLFVQLTFPEYRLSYVTKRDNAQPEAFVPTVDQVNAQFLADSEAIRADIEQTTASLLLNPKAYRADNCDYFISQILSPISVYNTLVVSGSVTQWLSYISQQGSPSPIEAYRKIIEGVVLAEYPALGDKLRDEVKRKSTRR